MKNIVQSQIKEVPVKIRKIREKRNYTQEYLASSLGITQNAYSKIELGYTKLSLERVLQIAIILEIELSEILG